MSFSKNSMREWGNIYNKENFKLERKHGPLVYPCLSPIMHQPDDNSDDNSDDEYDPTAVWREFYGNLWRD